MKCSWVVWTVVGTAGVDIVDCSMSCSCLCIGRSELDDDILKTDESEPLLRRDLVVIVVAVVSEASIVSDESELSSVGSVSNDSILHRRRGLVVVALLADDIELVAVSIPSFESDEAFLNLNIPRLERLLLNPPILLRSCDCCFGCCSCALCLHDAIILRNDGVIMIKE